MNNTGKCTALDDRIWKSDVDKRKVARYAVYQIPTCTREGEDLPFVKLYSYDWWMVWWMDKFENSLHLDRKTDF